jgi:hypothetical protein
MKFLVPRTTSFRDQTAWGSGIDVIDVVDEMWVYRRSAPLPRRLHPILHKLFIAQHGLRLLWASRKYDAIAVGRCGVWLPILLRLTGRRTPVVMTDIEWPGGNPRVRSLAGNAAAAICCNTQLEMESCSRHFSIPAKKFRHVRMAYQMSDMRSASDEGYIFAGGNFGRDWATLVDAVDGLPFPVRCFTSIGRLSRVASNMHVATVSRQQYYDQMAAASCVVVPVVHEERRVTGTTTWINAMAMGKVVIASDPCGAPDYIENGVSGFYVEHGDAEALRACIDRVMRDPALRQRVGRAARERARDQFSPEAFRAQIIDLLREAAGDPAQLAA